VSEMAQIELKRGGVLAPAHDELVLVREVVLDGVGDQHGDLLAGAYTRPLLSSTRAISDTEYTQKTPHTPQYPLKTPEHAPNTTCIPP